MFSARSLKGYVTVDYFQQLSNLCDICGGIRLINSPNREVIVEVYPILARSSKSQVSVNARWIRTTRLSQKLRNGESFSETLPATTARGKSVSVDFLVALGSCWSLFDLFLMQSCPLFHKKNKAWKVVKVGRLLVLSVGFVV